MNIFSLVIRAVPGRLEEVKTAVLSVQGVELHLEHEGRMIITIEDVVDVRSSDLLKQIQEIPYIASATLAYEYCDEEMPQSPTKSKEHLS
ncbi:chaperone NapD [Iodobacter sp. CM08]|uniref:chaperone NapD n=1 Tax=Iodobacter sp. CM08 TaxID=3085902 RepID=UPI00298167E3|nr:chaperone NapD [Iodobacter sp. CM08]MDW5416615.1 chaperone NapD [Iodobacter sp. CM08]